MCNKCQSHGFGLWQSAFGVVTCSKMASAEPRARTSLDDGGDSTWFTGLTGSLEQDDGMIHERPKLLEAIGLKMFSLSHFVIQNVKQLPFPLGATIKVLEDIIAPPMRPLVTCVKNQSLHLLSCIDDQLCFIGYEVEKRAPGISVIMCKVQDLHVLSWKIANRLHTQGVVRAVLDMLVEYKDLVKSKSDEAFNLVNKCSFLQILVPVMHTIGLPSALAGSNWLVTNSEVQDKDLLVCEEDASGLQICQLDTDLDEKIMIGDEVAKKESSMEAQKYDEQATNENPAVETLQHPQDRFPQNSRDEHPEDYVHNHGDLQDEITEDQSPGIECDTKDPHTQIAGQMPTDCSESPWNDESDESDEVINLFVSGWSRNPVIGVKK